MPYCAYLRKSRADMEAEARGEGETLARHQKRIEELAERMHIDLPPENFFREIVSGETIAARPVMQELLRQVEAGRWDGVLVVEVERLARGDTMDQGQVAKSFKLNGTKIITPAKTYDPNNEFDEEYFEFGLFMSRREYKTIRRRMNAGRISAAKEGKFIGAAAPYGYKKYKLEKDKGYSLEPVPEEAEVIRLIFEWYTRGDETGKRLGMPSICHKLDDMHIHPRTGEHWSRYTIKDILVNPVYIGKVRWGYKKETKTYIDGKIKKTRRKKAGDFILCDGIHEAIIDDVTFALASKMMKVNAKSTSTSKRPMQNPLSGLVYCRKCGTLMNRLSATKKTPYSFLKCPNYLCDNVSAPLDLIESEVLRHLKEWCDSYELELPEPELPDTLKTLRIQIEAEEKRKDTLELQLTRTYDLLEQGLYTQEIFRKRNSGLLGQIAEAERNILQMSSQYTAMSDAVHARTEFVPTVRHILEAYPLTEDAVEKNEMLRRVISKATYEKSTPNRRGNRDAITFDIDIFPLL